MDTWKDLTASRFGDALHEGGADKRASLHDAIQDAVKPGMKLNICGMQARSSSAIYEICRQFAGTRPGFEYIASSIGNYMLTLMHLGLLKKAIVSFAGESYPTPGPSPVVKRALEAGECEIENWTMLTISQRLLGGAMGVPYFPTRSLTGSSIGEELKPNGDFIELPDPARPGETIGLMTSYTPDVSFVHAWAADKYGNAICYPPFGENTYGAMAAREGAVVTAEHIVPTSFIREHANLVRLPAPLVRSVSHVPWGCHPAGNYSRNIPEFEPFGNDYQFMKECRTASKTAEAFDDWIQEWILDVKDHGEYVAKLGEDRKRHLHFVATRDSWRPEIEAQSETLSANDPPNPIERMIVEASRMLAKRIIENEYTTVLSGVGQATLLAWLAAHDLQEDGRDVTLMAETGIYGHDPRPADPFVFNFRNLPTTTVLTDIFETLGLHTGGGSNRCIGTIGAAQVDRHANVNSTRTSDGRHLVGSGGANDIATAAQETIVLAQQRAGNFVDRVDYVTSPGKRIQVVVSTLGRYEKRGGADLILTGVFLDEGQTREEAIAAVRASCGWELAVSDDCEILGAPTERELTTLRLFDCERLFIGKTVEKAVASAAAK